MDSVDSPSRLKTPAVVAFACAAVLVPWLARDVIPLDVWLRFLLPLLWLAVWSLACFGAGFLVIRIFPSNPENRLPAVIPLALGAAVLAFLAGIAAGLQHLSVLGLRGIFLGALILGLYALWASVGKIEYVPKGLLSPIGLILLLPAAFTIVLLSTPPVMYDVLHYQLSFPQQWLLHGGFLEFPRESFSYYPSAHGLLFSYALATVGPWGPSAINWWMGLLAVLTAGHLGQKLAGPAAGGWAMACIALTPAFLQISGYALADLAVAAFSGTALLVLFQAEIPWTGRAVLAGILVGSAVATKYLALATVLIPVFAVLLFQMLGEGMGRKKSIAGLGGFGAALLLVAGPWWIRNIAWTGNPLYPYMRWLFGGKEAVLNIAWDLKGNVDLPSNGILKFLYSAGAIIRRTFHPRAEAGLIGSHWLILLVLAAGLRSEDKGLRNGLWISALTGMLCWGFLVQYVRFLLPALVPAAALAGAAFAVLLSELGAFSKTVVTVFLVFLFGWNAGVMATPFSSERFQVVLGQLSEQAYRSHWDDVAAASDFVAESLPNGAKIYLLGESRCFGFMRPVIVEDPYRVPLIVELSRKTGSAEALARKFQSLGVSHLLMNRREIPRLACFHGIKKPDGNWDYWYPASKEERGRIRGFLDLYLKPLYDKDGVLVGEIRIPKPKVEQGGPGN